MMNKKEKKQKIVRLSSAIEAVTAAFTELKEIRPINLERGTRVGNTLSSGSLMQDLAVGGGYQRGRIVDIFGDEGVGKSTELQTLIASAQRNHVPVVHYDPETSADPVYMRAQGVDIRHKFRIMKKSVPGYYYTQPSVGEEIYRHMMWTMNRMPEFPSDQPGGPAVLFLVDSLAAMISESADEDTGKVTMGTNARMHSNFMPQIRARLARTGCLWVFVNQIRMKIGVMWGDPSVEPGGQAVKYYPDYKIRMRKRKVEDDKSGLKVLPFSTYTLKNKTYPPFQEALGSIVLGRGLDKAQDAHEFLTAIGRLEVKSGGKRRILLKRFDQGFMSWRDFRGVAETQDFRDYCFHLLTMDRTYTEYFKHQGFANYDYDAPGAQAIAPPTAQDEPDQEAQDDAPED